MLIQNPPGSPTCRSQGLTVANDLPDAVVWRIRHLGPTRVAAQYFFAPHSGRETAAAIQSRHSVSKVTESSVDPWPSTSTGTTQSKPSQSQLVLCQARKLSHRTTHSKLNFDSPDRHPRSRQPPRPAARSRPAPWRACAEQTPGLCMAWSRCD